MEIPRRWGFQQLIFLNVSMRLNWNFQLSGVFKSKTFHEGVGGMDFFWNNRITDLFYLMYNVHVEKVGMTGIQLMMTPCGLHFSSEDRK